MASGDIIPTSNNNLYILGKKATNGVLSDFGKYGILGATADWFNNKYQPAWNSFSNDFLAWEDPTTRLPVHSMNINDSKAIYVPELRQLNNMVRNNPGITNEDLYALGFPPRSNNKPTPVPIPTTSPEAIIEPAENGVVNIHFRDKGAANKAKPAGVHGVEIKWDLLSTKPETSEELTNSVFDTKTPYQFVFNGSQRGQRLYFSLRWENTRGEKGNWSKIYETFIP